MGSHRKNHNVVAHVARAARNARAVVREDAHVVRRRPGLLARVKEPEHFGELIASRGNQTARTLAPRSQLRSPLELGDLLAPGLGVAR